MKTPKTKADALELLRLLSDDFSMLASGDWTPDDASCAASLEVVEALHKYIEKAVP